MVAQASRLEALLVGRDDRHHRHFLGQGDVLEAVDHEGHLLRLGRRLGDDRHLLEIVDHDEEAPITREGLVLPDELPRVVDRAGGLGPAHEEEVLAVAGDSVERRSEPRIVRQLGPAGALGHPRPQDLLADVLDLDRTGLVGQVGERRFHGDQPVEEVLLLVLEADVEDVGLAAGRDVAAHLEGHSGLAGALRAADEEQLAGSEAAADRLVERREAQRNRLVLAHPARRDVVVEVDQDVQRRPRVHAAVRGVEAPGALGTCVCVDGLGAQGEKVLPVVTCRHGSTVVPPVTPRRGLSSAVRK